MQTGVRLRPMRAGKSLFGLPAIALEFLACVCGVQPCPEQSTGEQFFVGLLPLPVRDGLPRLMSVWAIGALVAEGHPRSLKKSGSGAIGWGTGRRGVRQGTSTMRTSYDPSPGTHCRLHASPGGFHTSCCCLPAAVWRWPGVPGQAPVASWEFDMSARYRDHRFDLIMTADESRLEQFLKSLEGGIIATAPNVSIGFRWMHRVDCETRRRDGRLRVAGAEAVCCPVRSIGQRGCGREASCALKLPRPGRGGRRRPAWVPATATTRAEAGLKSIHAPSSKLKETPPCHQSLKMHLPRCAWLAWWWPALPHRKPRPHPHRWGCPIRPRSTARERRQARDPHRCFGRAGRGVCLP